MHLVRKVISTAWLLILLATALQAEADTIDDSPEAVSGYTRGQRYLREGNWSEAAKVFADLESRFPDSKNLDLFVFNRGTIWRATAKRRLLSRTSSRTSPHRR